MVVIVDVPEGSAGFTCNDSLVITRLDEGACVRLVLCRSRVAGVLHLVCRAHATLF